MTRRRVIGEREIHRAAKEGRRTIDAAGAVVTPSARDEALRAGIAIAGEPAARSSAPRPASRQPAARRADAGGGSSKPAAPAAAAAPGVSPRRIAVGADHGGVALKDTIAARLRELGHVVTDHGTTGSAAVDYPDFAVLVARAVASGDAELGIMVDGAGIGSCMAANKVRGIRAAMCYDVTTAGNAREHNDANLLTLGGGLIGARLALEIVEKFLATAFGGGRHQARVDKIVALDRADSGKPRT